MANHKSALKRIRQTETRRDRNKYQAKTARNLIKKIRTTEDKKEAEALFPEISSRLDKLAKKNIIHHKKAANLKSSIAKRVASIGK